MFSDVVSVSCRFQVQGSMALRFPVCVFVLGFTIWGGGFRK